MAKQRRPAKATAKSRRSSKPIAVRGKAASKKAGSRKAAAKTAPARAARGRGVAARAGRSAPDVREPAAAPPQPVAPAVRKPGFYEAVAIYERGVQALQRHDFEAAAGFFRTVLERYPEERELLERARLYLRVCERETSRLPAAPKTPAERVYAATVALNAGDHSGALDHLQRALGEDPDSDHAHYIMAVALGMRGRPDEALDHLRLAIGLNPENRSMARQDPDLESIRSHERFRSALDTPPSPNRRRPAKRR
jgi:tetratricopeptide (TPR) repeat protein